MVLSQRERYIAIGGGSLLILLLYTLVVSPYFAKRAEIAVQLDATNADIEKIDGLFQQQKKLRKVWDDLNAGGLGNTPSEAESKLQGSLDYWAQECGVNVSALKYERSSPEGKFLQISFHLTGVGPLSTISTLLWRVETSTMPLRVNDIEIKPRAGKEGQDDLQLQMDVSTLCRIPDSDKPERLRTANSKEGGL